MNLSSDTLSILKNFSTINSNLVIRPGTVLKTMSEAKNIMAVATVVEEFPSEFGIYDLNEFLSVVGMFDDPSLVFDDDMKYITIVEGRRSVKYFFSDTSILTSPSKDITMPPTEVNFKLTADDLNAMRKAAGALGVNDVVITNLEAANSVSAQVTDIKDSTANSFAVALDASNVTSEPFKFVFNIANFKVLAGNYDVSVSSKLISNFKNTSGNVEYFIALEKSSTFGE